MTAPLTRDAFIDQMFAAIDRAEAQALADHEAGRCHLSEFSCSHCEREGR